jgi:hypothetical protein
MTKRWKSMSDAVHDIVCRSKTQPSKGTGIGIGGTGKAGTTTTLIGCSCVHSMHNTSFSVRRIEEEHLKHHTGDLAWEHSFHLRG